MTHVAISAVGADRPGIVAAVTGVLVDQGCNLEDSSMTILRGQFAMMLVVDAPTGRDAPALEAALAAVGADFDLMVRARAVDESAGVVGGGPRYTSVVYGADRPGIVNRVAAVLAGAGANVVDLRTRVIGDPERPNYAMVMEVELPASASPADGAALGAQLDAAAADLGVECSFHPSDADIL